MPIHLKRTPFHRLLRAKVGTLQPWVCSSASEGVSLADLLPEITFVFGVGVSCYLGVFLGWWVAPFAVICLVCSLYVGRLIRILKKTERLARARIRRHECVICGIGLLHGEQRACAACYNADFE